MIVSEEHTHDYLQMSRLIVKGLLSTNDESYSGDEFATCKQLVDYRDMKCCKILNHGG